MALAAEAASCSCAAAMAFLAAPTAASASPRRASRSATSWRIAPSFGHLSATPYLSRSLILLPPLLPGCSSAALVREYQPRQRATRVRELLHLALGSAPPPLLFCEFGLSFFETVCQDLGAKLGGLRLPLRLF